MTKNDDTPQLTNEQVVDQFVAVLRAELKDQFDHLLTKGMVGSDSSRTDVWKSEQRVAEVRREVEARMVDPLTLRLAGFVVGCADAVVDHMKEDPVLYRDNDVADRLRMAVSMWNRHRRRIDPTRKTEGLCVDCAHFLMCVDFPPCSLCTHHSHWEKKV